MDLSHPIQAGRTDGVHDNAAIMDTIPYSRVFYHAYPGAVIMHRGKKYKVHSMNSPPIFADCTIGFNPKNATLGAYAKPTSVRYTTRALSITLITVVKQFDRVELTRGPNKKSNEKNKSVEEGINEEAEAKEEVQTISLEKRRDVFQRQPSTPIQSLEMNYGAIAGNGVVTVKRTVHGYKKLSPVNRIELGRVDLSMPSMEFDTNALWVDTEADLLRPIMEDYDAGVHAVSHALLAVAPLFVPCSGSDINCDHSRISCTKVLLFDVRAGGAGTTSQLWKHFFHPDGMMDAAISLLEHCPTCSSDDGYEGGCPGCLQSGSCTNFNESLSRSTGLHIARRILARLQKSDLYRSKIYFPLSNVSALTKDPATNNVDVANCSLVSPSTSVRKELPCSTTDSTPRCHVRTKALQDAKDLVSARRRNILVGRPTWPMDKDRSDGKLQVGE